MFGRSVFTRRELRDLAVGAVALTLIYLLPYAFSSDFPLLFLLFFLFIGLGFALHEIAHKLTAIRFGAWSEFVLWPTGLFLGFLLRPFGFIFAAPGATMAFFYRPVSKEESAVISSAGPLANIVLALIFWLASKIFGPVFLYGTRINLDLALFNLLPFPPLDGFAIFRFSIFVWFVLYFATLLLKALLL